MRTPTWLPYEQGTDEWLKSRCGCLTASRMADAMAILKKGGESAERKRLKIALVAERMTDSMTSVFVSKPMEWGIQMEPFAKERYEEVTGTFIDKCGFALHGEIESFGASPDGTIGDDGLIEVKCPETATFISWVSDGVVPEQHKPQMLAQLAVTGRRYVDFFAFDPRVKSREHQHFLRRFEPQEADLVIVEEAARQFLAEVNELFDRITRIPAEEKEIA